MHAMEVDLIENVSLRNLFLCQTSQSCIIFTNLKIFSFIFENLDQQNSVKDVSPSQDIIDQIQRPSVDALLDELNVRSTSPVYAVPHDEVINLRLL